MPRTTRTVRRAVVGLVVHLAMFTTPSPVYASALPETLAAARELTAFERLDAVEDLREHFAQRAVRILKLGGRHYGSDHPYGGLSPSQAQAVLLIAETFGERHFEAAIRIAWCESRLSPSAINRANTNRTVDRGVFQLNDGGTMQRLGVDSLEAFDVTAAVLAARVLFDDRGWQPWACAPLIGLHGGRK